MNTQVVRDLEHFTRGCQAFSRTDFYMEEREDLEGPLCNFTVIFKENGDVIFQFFPKTKKWPRGEVEARALLTEILEVYFGDLGRFSGSYAPELESWAVRAQGLAQQPSYSRDHHVYSFASYVNTALAAL